MNIYIVRHGETQWNKEEVFRGRKDIPLNDTGEKQAKKVGAFFSGMPLKRIASSPLQKALQAAEAISAGTGAAIDCHRGVHGHHLRGPGGAVPQKGGNQVPL